LIRNQSSIRQRTLIYGNSLMVMEIAIVCSLGILNQLRRMRSTDHGTDTMRTFVNPLRPKS